MFTITTDRRTLAVQAVTRKGAIHAAIAQLDSGERVLTVRQECVLKTVVL